MKSPAASLFHVSVVASPFLVVGVAILQALGGVLESGVFIASSPMAACSVESIGMLALYADPLHKARAAFEGIASIVYAPLLPEVDESQALVLADPFDLELGHADFAYMGGTSVIADLDQALPGHPITTFVDPPGSGRSTLVRLIACFRDMDSDAIRFSGPDVREISNEVPT